MVVRLMGAAGGFRTPGLAPTSGAARRLQRNAGMPHPLLITPAEMPPLQRIIDNRESSKYPPGHGKPSPPSRGRILRGITHAFGYDHENLCLVGRVCDLAPPTVGKSPRQLGC